MTLCTITVNTLDQVPVRLERITAEQVTMHFALAPALARLDDGTRGIADSGCMLVHILSGTPLATTASGNMRVFAERLESADTGIDWDTADLAVTTDQRAQVQAILRELQESPEWPALSEYADQIPGSAAALLAELLQTDLTTAPQARIDDLIAQVGNLGQDDLARAVGDALRGQRSAIEHGGLTVRYLLAVLERIDRAAADLAAANLTCLWEYSDATEWLYRWAQESAAAAPLTLPGFPFLNLPAAPEAEQAGAEQPEAVAR